jgi:hypothetical protein
MLPEKNLWITLDTITPFSIVAPSIKTIMHRIREDNISYAAEQRCPKTTTAIKNM